MVNITIDPQLKKVWQQAALGCVQCRVVVQPSSRQLLEAIDVVCRRLMDSMSIEQIKSREHIAQTRACCKALGKDVKRNRNSAEALNRRVLQGKGLYQINNVVEVNNLLSLDTGYSLGSYDLERLEGDIVWKPAGEGVHYQGIGKEAVNIEFLPVLSDRQGFFGNPNSDSTRAMITPQTTQLLMCVFGFGGAQPLQPMLEQMCDALQTYCQATELETAVIV